MLVAFGCRMVMVYSPIEGTVMAEEVFDLYPQR